MMSQYNKKKEIPLFETFCRKNQIDGKTISVELCGKPLDLVVASTPRSQAKGFMGAEKQPSENEGMLFVYDRAEPLSFWMKDVPFGLDIIFFDDEQNYLGHETMDPHSGETEEHLPKYNSKEPARFAVELQAGWCDKNLVGKPSLIF